MDSLARETYELTLRVCSGERSAGERAGHAQVQIWRNWTLTKPTDLSVLRGKSTTRLAGTPIPLSAGAAPSAALMALQWAGLPAAQGAGLVSEHIGTVAHASMRAVTYASKRSYCRPVYAADRLHFKLRKR